MTAPIFPVGHYTGARVDHGRAIHTVRVGWRQHKLDEDAFALWALAHGVPENGKAAWTEADVLRRAGELRPGEEAVTDRLGTLAAAGLITSVDDEEKFCRTHRLGVLFVGLGNSRQRPDRYSIGLPGHGAAATVDSSTYQLWQWGSVVPTLWHSCELRATMTSAAGRTTSALQLAPEVLGDLRPLIASGCAYLDMVVTG
ncbi:hypothetical protein AB0P21_36975 [Kribbella sp. NPDC056861]|uniref:hypothetical protein n=1 Tax=Kribbella sp. NPDC056861 TaxID=3154857 RepID=UPI0034169DDA